MQAKSWKYMLQTNGNYSNIQKATDKTFKLYNANFKTEYTIYLMECIICNLQYASKNETPFKISLNNHRKDVKDPKAIVADKHFLKKMVIDLTNTQDSWEWTDWQTQTLTKKSHLSYSKRKLLDTKIRYLLS